PAASGNTPTLSISIQGDSIKGIWTGSDGTTVYPVRLAEAATPQSVPLLAVGAVDSAQYLKFKTDTPTLKIAVSFIAAADNHTAWLNEAIKAMVAENNQDAATL